MEIVDVWITCPDAPTARAIATALIEQRLVACANLIRRSKASIAGRGVIERAEEVALALKTRSCLFDRVAVAATGLHLYALPAIHAVAAVGVTDAYRAWVEAETATPA